MAAQSGTRASDAAKFAARFKKQTLLVLGGAGFIGSNFVRKALAQHGTLKIVCFDALTYAGSLDNLEGLPDDRFVFVKGDITDGMAIRKVLAEHKPDYAINFAAESHVDRSIHGAAAEFFNTNVLGVVTLLEALRGCPNLKRFVQVSTDEVYGSLALGSRERFTERTMLAPNSPYAASKASADLVVRSFFKTYGLPAVITRCSNNYGPYQFPEKLIPFSIGKVLNDEPLTIYGDGKNVRDWIHVDDHIDALLRALAFGESGDIYNIGASDEVSNIDLARTLLSHFGKGKKDMVFVTDRPGHDRRYAIDSTKARRKLGWKPFHTVAESLGPTIEWYVAHQEWVAQRLPQSNQHMVTKPKARAS